MKKVIAVLLVTILSLFTIIFSASCAGKNSYPVEKDATVITFYAYDFEEWSNTWMYDKVKEFNSILDDGIQVEMYVYEDSAYTSAIKSAREGNRAPDINMVSYGNIYEDVKQGYNADMLPLMGQEAFDDLTSYAKEMVTYKNSSGENTYYAYPQLVEPSSLLFYNKEILSNAGVNTDPSKWTFADLVEACSKIKPTLQRNQYTIGLPTAFPLAWSTIGLQYNCSGIEVLNQNWDNTNISSIINTNSNMYQSENGYANMLRLYWDLYAGGYVPLGNVSPTGYNDIIDALCGKKLAMTYAGSWSIAEIMNTYPEMANKIGVCPIPTTDGNKNNATATNGGWTYAISSTSTKDHQQKAATFLKWLLTDDITRTSSYFETAHYSKYPVNKSIQNYINNKELTIDKSWMEAVSSVADSAIAEPIYTFDISLKISTMFEWVSINAKNGLSANQVDNLFKQQLNTCISEIKTIISANKLAGTNPRI